jgi:FKBP-type peptidyl-prolyl cis-trans isomerase 2
VGPRSSVALLLALACACSRGPDGTVKPGSLVRLDYKLDVDGKPFESTQRHGPVEIVQGSGDLPAAVDKALLGMKAGQRADLDLSARDGFGSVDPAKIESLPLASMGAMGADVAPGKKILGFKDGKPVSGRVLEVRDGVARVDFNHPLADKALRYRLEVVAVDPPPAP